MRGMNESTYRIVSLEIMAPSTMMMAVVHDAPRQRRSQ